MAGVEHGREPCPDRILVSAVPFSTACLRQFTSLSRLTTGLVPLKPIVRILTAALDHPRVSSG
eukprot:scaffold3731_cov381-Prasinococcus_capsulatus_cf.AAC.12